MTVQWACLFLGTRNVRVAQPCFQRLHLPRPLFFGWHRAWSFHSFENQKESSPIQWVPVSLVFLLPLLGRGGGNQGNTLVIPFCDTPGVCQNRRSVFGRHRGATWGLGKPLKLVQSPQGDQFQLPQLSSWLQPTHPPTIFRWNLPRDPALQKENGPKVKQPPRSPGSAQGAVHSSAPRGLCRI